MTSDDLVQFGMIRELLGRFPSLAILEKPSIEFLKTALTVPKNNLLWQYEKLLNYDGVSLKVCDDVIEYIAKEAFEKKTGCRGLRAICDKIFLNIMFEAPDMVQKEVVVNMDLVRKCERKSNNGIG